MSNQKNLDTVAYIVRASARNRAMALRAARVAKASRMMIETDDDGNQWLYSDYSDLARLRGSDSDEVSSDG